MREDKGKRYKVVSMWSEANWQHEAPQLPQIPNFNCTILRTWIHPVPITLEPHRHYVISMWIIAHHLAFNYTKKKKQVKWGKNKGKRYKVFLLFNSMKAKASEWERQTGCGLFELTSNNRMWGLPAAARKRLSGVISSLLTCYAWQMAYQIQHKLI